MSELEDLEEIAEQTRHGTSRTLLPNSGRLNHRPVSECCSAGHPRTPENTRIVKRGRRTDRFCLICEVVPKVRKPRYCARDYPL
ncbi:hypothetical protein ABIB86_000389 [Bradyrhizobium sp. JR1.7]